MKTIAVIILLFFTQLVYGQLEEEDVIREKEKTPKQEFKDKFYLGLVSSYYIDFVTAPLTFDRLRVGAEPDPNDPTKYIDKYENVPFQTTYNSFFSMGVEPRYNIKDFNKNLAFGIAAPITIGFGQAFASNENVFGASGFGSIQVPILAKIYLGTASTYASDEDFGLSAGVGFEINKIGIIAPGASELEQDAMRAWVMPSASAAVHFWRGTSPMEVNVKYGFGPISEYRTDKYGQVLSQGPRSTRASSIKLTFVYLMNY